MSKLIPMEEAAKMLGISVERLAEHRSNNEIFGYRDGANWKFKPSELKRFADEMGIELKEAAPDSEISSAESGYHPSPSDKDLVLDSAELSDIGGEPSRLDSRFLDPDADSEDEVIEISAGRPVESLEESHIDLSAEEDGISLDDSGRLSGIASGIVSSDDMGSLGLLDGDEQASSGNVIDDDEDDQLSFGASSLRLAAESSKKLLDDGDSSVDILGDEPASEGSPSDTGKMLGGDDDLLMSEEDLFSDSLSLSESASFEGSSELGSDFDDSSDLVLEDSDSSTEITLEANQSGISLSPNESGIALADEPLDLGGSDIDALELPEDDDMIVLEDAVGPDQATMMQEDDFNLTPLETFGDDDSSTGSQVIALEDSEIYADDSAGVVLGESEEFEAQPAMLDESMDDSFGQDPYGDPAMVPGAMVMPAAAALPEAPYTGWQVASLGIVAFFLMLGGMVAYNLATNIWMPEDEVIGSSVLNFFLKLTNMNG